MTEEKKPETEEVKETEAPEEDKAEERKDEAKAPEETSEEAEKTEEEPAEKDPLAELQQKYSELEDSRLRLMAEYQNYRRRTEKEKSDIYAYANEEFAKQLLGVLDNFERAMETETEDAKYKEGMELILRQLRDVMEKNHVEEIDALSKPFDPNCHHAVMNVQSEELESGTVAQVLQKGYTLNKKVIRPAMVAVTQ